MASRSESGNFSSVNNEPAGQVRPGEPLRILMLAANPVDRNRLALKRERRLLRRKMMPNIKAGACDLRLEWAATAEDLQDALTAYKPHIVHFSGHGGDESICLEDDERKSHPLSKLELALLFNLARGWLRLVVLNACYSALQVESLSQLVDFVVGTNVPIADEAALQFTDDFYRAIANGGTVREAFNNAQKNAAHGERYEFVVRPGANETTRLLPPTSNTETELASKRIKARKLRLAGNIFEGQDALSIDRAAFPNEKNSVRIKAEITEADEIDCAGSIFRQGKDER